MSYNSACFQKSDLLISIAGVGTPTGTFNSVSLILEKVAPGVVAYDLSWKADLGNSGSGANETIWNIRLPQAKLPQWATPSLGLIDTTVISTVYVGSINAMTIAQPTTGNINYKYDPAGTTAGLIFTESLAQQGSFTAPGEFRHLRGVYNVR